METLLRKMTAFEEEDRPEVKNGDIFKLPEYIQLMTGSCVDLT